MYSSWTAAQRSPSSRVIAWFWPSGSSVTMYVEALERLTTSVWTLTFPYAVRRALGMRSASSWSSCGSGLSMTSAASGSRKSILATAGGIPTCRLSARDVRAECADGDPAAVAGTALLLDAWFDLVTARAGSDFRWALATAVLGELPLAALCFWIACEVEGLVAAIVVGESALAAAPPPTAPPAPPAAGRAVARTRRS